MTNLLTFFVLLVTFSSYDEDTRQSIRSLGTTFRRIFPGPVKQGASDRSALTPANQIVVQDEPAHGAERPTEASVTEKEEGTLKQSPRIADYEKRKVFVMASEKIFLGNTAVLSPEGRRLLPVMASYLKEMPARVVITEHGPPAGGGDENLGLSRGWAVLKHLTAEQNLDRRRFSISGRTMLDEGDKGEQEAGGGERMLEIVLLERSIHD
jgi:flagellar motor protein MotB